MAPLNKKVRNATPKVYDNIHFRSTLEVTCYKKLKEANLKFEYEPKAYVLLMHKILSNVTVIQPNRNGDMTKYTNNKLRDMTYTPDFVVEKDGAEFVIEVKGRPNDVYPVKKKLFLNYLQSRPTAEPAFFIEPHNVKQVEQAINFIKNYSNGN